MLLTGSEVDFIAARVLVAQSCLVCGNRGLKNLRVRLICVLGCAEWIDGHYERQMDDSMHGSCCSHIQLLCWFFGHGWIGGCFQSVTDNDSVWTKYRLCAYILF